MFGIEKKGEPGVGEDEEGRDERLTASLSMLSLVGTPITQTSGYGPHFGGFGIPILICLLFSPSLAVQRYFFFLQRRTLC